MGPPPGLPGGGISCKGWRSRYDLHSATQPSAITLCAPQQQPQYVQDTAPCSPWHQRAPERGPSKPMWS